MFKKPIIFFIFISYQISLVSFAYSEIVNKIIVTGNERVPQETVTMLSGYKINQEIDLNDINKILKNIYDSNFFENVKVSFKDNILNIYVEEKKIIQEIFYNGIKSTRIKEEIFANRILRPKSSYDIITVKNDRDIILDVLKQQGYYFATIETTTEDVNNNINLTYNIDMGSKSKIKKISFIGDKIYKDKKLQNIIISEEYKFWKFISGKKFLNENIIELDKRLLKNFYLNKGYYQVEINSSFAKMIGNNEFELIYNIQANDKFFFNNVSINLSFDYEEDNFVDLKEELKDIKDEAYSLNTIKDIIQKIEYIALTDQFQAIKLTPEEIVTSNKIDLIFNIEDSDKFFVEKINIFGNNVTQENVIRNQMEIDEGDPFNDILYNKSINNIKNLRFFKSTDSEIKNGSDESSKIIEINVVEQATGEISLGAGAGTDGATVAFGVKENNFLGKGINLDAGATLTEETLKGKFSVKLPNYKNTNKSIYTSIEALEIDRTSAFGYKSNKTGFIFGTNFEYLNDFNLGIGSSNFYEKISTDANASTLQKTQEGNYWDSFVKLDFDYDKRNQKFQTSKGFRSTYSLDLPIVSDTNTLFNSYHYNYYTALFDENLTNASILIQSANSLSGDNIKLSERLFVPGRKLRGFERGKIGPKDGEDYVGGNFVSSANISSTIPQVFNNLQQLDFVMFLDTANVWGVDYDSSIDDAGKFRSSVGLGIDWMTPIGPVNFILAQPITKESTDKTETFRFNIGTTF